MTAKEYILALPEKINKSAIPDGEALIHLKLSGEGGGDFTIEIRNNNINITEGLIGNTNSSIAAKADDFMKIIKGEANGPMMFMTGKIKVENLGALMKYAKLFNLM